MTPATDSIAMVRWAWAQGAERRATEKHAPSNFWSAANAAALAIEIRWNAENEETWAPENGSRDLSLSLARCETWGEAMLAWKDVYVFIDRFVDFGHDWDVWSRLAIAELWLKPEPLIRACAECMLSWLTERFGTTWDDVTVSVLTHGDAHLREAVMLGGLPRTGQLAEAA